MVATDERILHVLVDSDRFDIPIPYRAQRLAKFLAAREATETVVWVYPSGEKSGLWELTHVQDGIYELPVPARPHWSLLDKPIVSTYYTDAHYTEGFEDVFDGVRSDLNYLWLTKPIVWNLLDFEWDRTVYDCSDHMTTVGWETRSEVPFSVYCRRLLGSVLLTDTERKIADAVDTIFVSSEFLYEKLENATTHDRLFLVETGVDFDLFRNASETHEAIESIQRPRLGFAGMLKKKIDFELVSDLARRNRGWNIVMIGPKRGVDEHVFGRLCRQENVHWIDYVPHEEMASVLNALDLGLMPYKNIEYNRGVVPLKLFEYLACELPVVGCGLPSTTKYTREDVYLHTSNDPVEFARACETALSWRTGAAARVALAETADWEEKFARIYERTVTEPASQPQSA